MTDSIADSVRELFAKRSFPSQIPAEVNPFTGEGGFTRPILYPAPASANDLEAFANETGVTLPNDVCKLLRIANGAAGFYGTTSAQEGCRIADVWEHVPEWKTSGWIPLGDDGLGNYYVRTGSKASASPVCFVESLSPQTPIYAVASDALMFALFSLEEEVLLNKASYFNNWPFDRAYVLAKDPSLERFAKEFTMPWDIVG